MAGYNVKSWYNSIALDYAVMERWRYFSSFYFRAANRYMEQNSFDIVIDIGCGSGVLVNALAAKHPLVRFIGIDISENLLDMARAQNRNKNAEFVNADLSEYKQELINLGLTGKKVLFLLFGVVAHYQSSDLFIKTITDIWNTTPNAMMIVTYHNKLILFRSFFIREGKKYWTEEEALAVFCNTKAKLICSRYFHFLIFAFFISTLRLRFGHRLLLLIERLLAKVPLRLRKMIFTDFLHVYQRI